MILTIAHTKGGVGKSTLAWQLAHSILDRPITIIDLDFQQTLHYINQMGGGVMNVLQPQSSNELIQILSSIPKEEFVLIDVGGFDSDINRTAIKYSDKVLIPISDSITEVLGFKTFQQIIREINTDTQFMIVLNNIHPNTRNFDIIREAVADTKIHLLDTIVRSRKVYKATMGASTSVFEVADADLAQREITGVRDEIL